MIGLSSPSELIPQSLIQHPGSFLWWYVDACDQNGNGFVLIWSWGLPFLPGLASNERNGKPVPAATRPAVTLSVYENFKQTFYLFEELKTEEAQWKNRNSGKDCWNFGSCLIEYANSETNCTLTGEIQLEIPGQDTPLTGQFRLSGSLRKDISSDSPEDPNHQWCPISVQARCSAHFETDSYSFSIQDLHAYHDRNASLSPLHRLGIKQWLWGRAAFPAYELIWYILHPHEGDSIKMLLRIDSEGNTTYSSIVHDEQSGWVQSIYGLGYSKSLHLNSSTDKLHAEYTALIDDGPFYQRYMVTATHNEATSHDQQGYGFAELVVPDKVDPDWMSWLIKMRVKHPQINSFWLPLFTGPARTRIQRTVSQLWT